jgi:dTDP-4-amino-4,6-dideoxygalactose transaminase
MYESLVPVPFNDLSRRFFDDSPLLGLIKDIVMNGPYLKSKYTTQIESDFADFIGVDYCVGVSSGSAALELSLKALELPIGSEVLMAANAGGYSSIASRNAGLTPSYLDVDENGLLDVLNPHIELRNASAIIATHLYGQICDMNQILEFAKQHNLRVIEDCAQAAGAAIDKKIAGSFGDISTFSFYPTKNLGGIGDSGAICTNDPELHSKVISLREYGWAERYFAAVDGGGNFRMDEIQAVVLSDQLKVLAMLNHARLKIWMRYAEICKKYKVRILGEIGPGFVAHLAVIRVPNRNAFIEYMNSMQIETTIHYPFPDYVQPGLNQKLNINLPRTKMLCDEVVSIPLFPQMREDEICRVEAALEEYFGAFHEQ